MPREIWDSGVARSARWMNTKIETCAKWRLEFHETVTYAFSSRVGVWSNKSADCSLPLTTWMAWTWKNYWKINDSHKIYHFLSVVSSYRSLSSGRFKLPNTHVQCRGRCVHCIEIATYASDPVARRTSNLSNVAQSCKQTTSPYLCSKPQSQGKLPNATTEL